MRRQIIVLTAFFLAVLPFTLGRAVAQKAPAFLERQLKQVESHLGAEKSKQLTPEIKGELRDLMSAKGFGENWCGEPKQVFMVYQKLASKGLKIADFDDPKTRQAGYQAYKKCGGTFAKVKRDFGPSGSSVILKLFSNQELYLDVYCGEGGGVEDCFQRKCSETENKCCTKTECTADCKTAFCGLNPIDIIGPCTCP